MAEETTHNEIESRRFLLGEMSEAERARFEEKFVADADLFDLTRVVEDELIESYVRGTLSADERAKFERNFLATEARRQRVAFARTMINNFAARGEIVVGDEKTTETISVWNSIINFFKFPQIALAVAALLVLILGGWFWLKKANQPEIVRIATPTPTVEIVQSDQNQNSTFNQNVAVNSNANFAAPNLSNENISPNANRKPPNENRNSNTPKSESTNAAPVLALFVGTTRSGGKMPELNLPKNVAGANLQLNLESQDYKTYRVEMVDPNGKLILQNNNLRAKNSKINFFVSAADLRRGDYLIKVSALNPNNESESVADFAFRVNRR